MADFLIESGLRSNRPSVVQAMMSATNAKYEENKRIMGELATQSEQLSQQTYSCQWLTRVSSRRAPYPSAREA